MDRFASILAVALLAMTAWAAAQEEPNTFEAYPVTLADPAAQLQIVQRLLGTNGTATLDGAGARLLVVTTPERHRQIAAVFRESVAPPVNVRLDVRSKGARREDETAAGVGLDGGMRREEGLTHTTVRVRPQVRSTSVQGSSDVLQTLVVASGREASLEVSEQVPCLEWLVDYGLRGGVFAQRINWQRVGSFLVVQPTVVDEGPMIRVRLTPELSGWADGSPYRTRFTALSTEVVVQDGQTFQVGGFGRNEDFYSRFLIGAAGADRTESVEISLTPHIIRQPGMEPLR